MEWLSNWIKADMHDYVAYCLVVVLMGAYLIFPQARIAAFLSMSFTAIAFMYNYNRTRRRVKGLLELHGGK